jgi:hypothetical protein
VPISVQKINVASTATERKGLQKKERKSILKAQLGKYMKEEKYFLPKCMPEPRAHMSDVIVFRMLATVLLKNSSRD